ncbi:RhoGAP domain-containing protein [Cavenderia fasciculata]|uniref:RhoGAP domain-containing protein n=1 Tax=Cavenderia fasciculata TaxID=261658 RepID=F4PMV1_CACFS|nr:RhoGAP domain-containing protein [Cavenderia fasciculata]EGG23695.1 RhoGAP domain-containing protein [Cavenderia fasciculata]|eukprot:XP_004361546.1 RhoGAP domain-containing protein [Cavenderia fasciculata]
MSAGSDASVWRTVANSAFSPPPIVSSLSSPNFSTSSSSASTPSSPTVSSPRHDGGEDFLGQGKKIKDIIVINRTNHHHHHHHHYYCYTILSAVPTKTVIINILNKFLKGRPVKEDLVQSRVLKSEFRPIGLRYSVIELLCNHLEKNALEIEGIFRISGSANQIRIFWSTFGSDNIEFPPAPINEHNISGALKLYIREQVEPLIPFDVWSGFVSNLTSKNLEIDCNALIQLCSRMTSENQRILKRVVRLMVILVRHSSLNKMNPFNMGIVFGPSLFKSKSDSPNIFNEAKYSNEVVTMIIQNYNRVFPDLEVPILGTETNTENESPDDSSSHIQPIPTSSIKAVVSAVNAQTPAQNRSHSPLTLTPIGSTTPNSSASNLLKEAATRRASISSNSGGVRRGSSGSTGGGSGSNLDLSSTSSPDIHPQLLDAQHMVDETKSSPLAHMKPTDFSMVQHLRKKLSKTKQFKNEEIWDHFLSIRVQGNLVQAQKQFSTMMSSNSSGLLSSTMIVDKKKKKEKSSDQALNNAAANSAAINFTPIYILVTSRNIFFFDTQNYAIESIIPHERLKEFAFDSVNPGLFSFLDSATHRISYFLIPRSKILDSLTKSLERGRAIAKLSNKTLAHLQARKFAMLESSSTQGFGKLAESRPVFESLAASGFSELDVWEGTVDLLEVVKKFSKILVPVDPKAVVEFLLPGIPEFNGIYRKSYKLDINTSVFKIICLICEKAKLAPSKFVLRTLKGRTLFDNGSLAQYGLGTLFTTWQLRLISLDSPESTGNFVVEFQLPDSPEFKNMQKKSIKVDAYQPLKRIMKGLCDKLRVPKYHYYDLIGPEGQVLSGDDILSSIGLGIKFKTCKMKLQKKVFPVGKGPSYDTPICRAIVEDITDAVWAKLQDRHRERIRIYCKHLLDYIVDQTFVEISKAETVPKRVSMLGRNSRAEFYALLAQKEEEDLILQNTDGYRNMVIRARMVGGTGIDINPPTYPSQNYPLFKPTMVKLLPTHTGGGGGGYGGGGMVPLPRGLNGAIPTLRDIKVSNATNAFMSELKDVRDHLNRGAQQQGNGGAPLGQSILAATNALRQTERKFKTTIINNNSTQLNSIVLQLQMKPGTSKLVQQLKSRMNEVNLDSTKQIKEEDIEDLIPSSFNITNQ